MTEKSDSQDSGGTDIAHELDAPPWLRVESTLMATARLIRKSYDDRLDAFDLNLTSASLLMYVVEQGSLSQTALAARLDVGRAAAGLVVDRLEKRGLVDRMHDSSDKRAWIIGPTQAGIELAAKIADVDTAMRERLRSGVTREARQDLARLLLQMQQNLLS